MKEGAWTTVKSCLRLFLCMVFNNVFSMISDRSRRSVEGLYRTWLCILTRNLRLFHSNVKNSVAIRTLKIPASINIH